MSDVKPRKPATIVDPFYVQVLHSTFSVVQCLAEFKLMPKVEFFYADHGVCYSAYRKLDDGREVDRISSWLMPNIVSVPETRMRGGQAGGISWVVPVDDSHYVQVMAIKLPKDSGGRLTMSLGGKNSGEMTEEEHPRIPGDYEAQAGQGPISLHSEEHLVTSDHGIVMQRRLLERQIKLVAKGGDPIGVTYDEAQALVKIRSGNFFRTSEAAG